MAQVPSRIYPSFDDALKTLIEEIELKKKKALESKDLYIRVSEFMQLNVPDDKDCTIRLSSGGVTVTFTLSCDSLYYEYHEIVRKFMVEMGRDGDHLDWSTYSNSYSTSLYENGISIRIYIIIPIDGCRDIAFTKRIDTSSYEVRNPVHYQIPREIGWNNDEQKETP